jgi:hypothetical protein
MRGFSASRSVRKGLWSRSSMVRWPSNCSESGAWLLLAASLNYTLGIELIRDRDRQYTVLNGLALFEP